MEVQGIIHVVYDCSYCMAIRAGCWKVVGELSTVLSQ